MVDSGPLPRSQRLEKEKGAKKRAVKEFLFSRKGTVPRNLVNIKLKGQTGRLDRGRRERACVCARVYARSWTCAHACARRHKACCMCFVGRLIMCRPVGSRLCLKGCGFPEIDKSRELWAGGRGAGSTSLLGEVFGTGWAWWTCTVLLLVS